MDIILNWISDLFTKAPKDLWLYLTFGAVGAAIGTGRRISKRVQLEAERSFSAILTILQGRSLEDLENFLDRNRSKELKRIVRTRFRDYTAEFFWYIMAGAFLAVLVDHHYIISGVIGLVVSQILDILDFAAPQAIERLLPGWLKTLLAKSKLSLPAVAPLNTPINPLVVIATPPAVPVENPGPHTIVLEKKINQPLAPVEPPAPDTLGF